MTAANGGGPRLPFTRSIGTKIFVAFFAMGAITCGLGGYGLYSLIRVGDIVADTYDRPLMAINYARSANFVFGQMEKEALRRTFAAPADRGRIDGTISQLTSDFYADLAVAQQRSLADDEQRIAEDIRQLVQTWTTLLRDDDGAGAQALSDRIEQRFDALTELTADHSFLERRKSVLAVSRFVDVGMGMIVLAIVMSAAITIYLTRRISRPLSAAAVIADRIGQGELQTVIPAGGRDETGVLLNSLKVMQDSIRIMMEREQAQRQSAQSRLIDAVESSREAMVLVGSDGRIALANSEFARLFPAVVRLFGQDDTAEPIEAGQLIEEHDKITPAQILMADGEFQLPDGTWINVSRSSTRDGGLFLFLSDITDLKEREKRYKDATIAAETASIAKSQFLSNMSHELRTPLNAIIGFSDIFLGQFYGPLGDARYVEHAKDINAGGWRLLEIVRNVLDLSTSQQGKLDLRAEPIDLREIVDNCSRGLIKSGQAAGLTVSIRSASEPLMVHGDAEKLTRILDNLASNAVKFTKAGGTVTVAVRGDDGAVVLEVIDTGIGIAQADIAIALEPFGQADAKLSRHFEGTGLGLPLAKALVELHGGTLTLDSEPGRGTRVIVRFDRLAVSPVDAPAAQTPVPAMARAGAR